MAIVRGLLQRPSLKVLHLRIARAMFAGSERRKLIRAPRRARAVIGVDLELGTNLLGDTLSRESVGGCVSTVNARMAGVASPLPAESVAVTENVWGPSARAGGR